MEILSMLSLLIRGLSVISRDRELGARGESLGRVLDMAALAIERGEDGAAELKALVEKVKEMAEASRDPTVEEWASLKARSDEAHRILSEVPDANP